MLNETITKALSTLNKKSSLIEVADYEQVERIPTGSFILDWITGGGLPRGRFTTLSGWESSGKSTVSQIIASSITNNGGNVMLIDTEGVYDPQWGARVGINPSNFLLNQPQSGEQALDAISALLFNTSTREVFDLIILDSVAEMPWTTIVEANAADQGFAVAARIWTPWYTRILPALRNYAKPPAMLFINQLRAGIPTGPVRHAAPTEPGGVKHRFAASIRMRMGKSEVITANGKKVGLTFGIKTLKNKTAPVGREMEFPVMIGEKIRPSVFLEIARVGAKVGLFTNSRGGQPNNTSNWFFGEEQIGKGEGEVIQWLIGDGKEKFEEIQVALRDLILASNKQSGEGEVDSDE